MLSVIRSELTKIVTLPTVWIVTGIVLALHTLVLLLPAQLIADAVENITPDGIIEVFIGQPQPAEVEILGLLVSSSLQAGLFLPVIAAVIAGQEFRSGQLGLAVLAVPRRGRLLAGKIAATGLYALAVGILITALSTGFMYQAVKDWNPGLLLTADAFAGHARFIAFAVLLSLTTLAMTLIARSTLTGIIITVILIAITMTQLLATTVPHVDALFPFSAARNLLLDPSINTLTASPDHGLAILIGWAVLTTAGAGVALWGRDAR